MHRFALLAVLVTCSAAARTDAADDKPTGYRQVSVEMTIYEGPAAAIKSAKAGDEMVTQLETLVESGKIAAVTRLRLSALEQQQATLQFGKRSTVRVGGREAFGGRGGAVLRGENTGTMLAVTPRIAADDSILVEVQFEQSGLGAAPDPAAGDEPGAPDVDTLSVGSTVRVRNGGSVVLGGQAAEGKSGRARLIVLTARAEKTPAVAPAEKTAKRNAEFRIFALQNIRAADAVTIITGLIPTTQKLAVVADERTNSLVVRGDGESLEVVEAILMRLDEKTK